ncbi:MAG: hypothetical protein ACI85U_004246, partial [Candidatus Promineifilaceae bacterium]
RLIRLLLMILSVNLPHKIYEKLSASILFAGQLLNRHSIVENKPSSLSFYVTRRYFKRFFPLVQ